VRDLRMKIAAFAVALGLGGLGGYAISATKTTPTATGTLAEGTKVVRRTVHAKRPKVKTSGPPNGASTSSLSSAPISTGSSGSSSSGSGSGRPVQTGSSGSSGSSGGGSSKPPVSTGSSGGGAGGGAGGGGEGGDGGGEHERGD
jgi:hypothetical protein